MTVEILFIFSILLLLGGWFFWLRERNGASFSNWRKLLAWIALSALSGGVAMFARFLMLMDQAENANLDLITRLQITTPLERYGFWSSSAALLLSWSPTPKTSICIALASVIILVLWLAQSMGV